MTYKCAFCDKSKELKPFKTYNGQMIDLCQECEDSFKEHRGCFKVVKGLYNALNFNRIGL